MGIDQQTVEEIVKRILGVVRPARIILFGSAASGTMTRDSDIDLLVVVSSLADPRGASARIRSVLRGMGFPFDVVVMETERFEESKDVIGGIAYPASRSGRIIYEAA